MITHHPDENLLLEYSAASLSDPMALCVRLHLSYCAHCRDRLDMLNSLGATLLEASARRARAASETGTGGGPDSALFEGIMARIENEPPQPAANPHKVEDNPLPRILGADLDELPWKKQLGDVSVCDLTEKLGSNNERITLQKLLAGGRAPVHTHQGEEATVVLTGAFTDENGLFDTGDFVVLDKRHVHRPVALAGEDCITFSVLTGPLRLTGTFTRLLNPFIR